MATLPRGLGWKKDPPRPFGAKPDHDAAVTLGTAPPPPAASNMHLVLSILDQGQASACVAHAIPQIVRMAHARAGIDSPQLMSRLFGYYCSRAIHGAQHVDEGTYLRCFFQALNQVGFCPERLWPYVLDNINEMPSSIAERAAFDQRSPTVYERITSVGAARVDDVKRAIAAGYGVAFGTLVSEDFCADRLGSGPIEPPIGLAIAGGHALCLAAYQGDSFTVVNSWSEDWADAGTCQFSADYISWAMSEDFWLCAQAPAYSE